MRKLSWFLVALLALQVVTPSGAAAQDKDEHDAKDFMKDVLGGIFGPRWNMYLTGGAATAGRYLLQRPTGAITGEQSVEGKTGYSFGVGGGGDYFLRQGYRVYYTYAKNDLTYRTNNGDGSSALDVDPGASLHSNTVGVELIRYMLPAKATVSPYGTIGLSGTWWGLDSSPLVIPAGGSTQFKMGANVAFGVQYRGWEQFGARLEASKANVGNPFTGKNSFRTVGAIPFEEPDQVGHWDYRVAGVYYFKKKDAPATDRTISKQH